MPAGEVTAQARQCRRDTKETDQHVAFRLLTFIKPWGIDRTAPELRVKRAADANRAALFVSGSGDRMEKKRAQVYGDPRWLTTRRAALKRDHYRCVVCNCSVAGKGQARVDHIKPVTQGGAPFDVDNCRTLCVLHDNQSHREKGRGGAGPRDERFVIIGCDEDGMPTDPAHHWNRALISSAILTKTPKTR